jgi:hypothetical protein
MDTSTFKAYHNKKGMESKLELLLKLTTKLKKQKLKKKNF